MTRRSLYLVLLLVLLFYGIAAEGDLCQLDRHDEGMTGYSTKGCQAACTGQTEEEANGMCVLGQCYCIGSCQNNNHDECTDICQKLSLDWIGICSNGECSCLS